MSEVICSHAANCTVKDCAHRKKHDSEAMPGLCVRAWCDHVSAVCECVTIESLSDKLEAVRKQFQEAQCSN